MPPLRLRNTYTRSIEPFVARDETNLVYMYSCGPTVYSHAHIGNFRTFLLSDILRRVLEQRGFRVKLVMNVTDVGHMTEDHLADASGEDKLAKAARELGWDPYKVAAHFEHAFAQDAAALRLKNYDGAEAEQRELHPRATEHVSEMLAMIQTLIERGFAYVDDAGQVYFDVAKFPEYGQLSGKVLADLETGARVSVRDEKRDPRDFALWKIDDKHLMRWDPHSPAGWPDNGYQRLRALVPGGIDSRVRPGFPGWHIECSAMALTRLGPVIDIHTGGEDNIFPHHECEIAQTYGARASADAPSNFARYWVHSRHLLVNGAKMSKRDGSLIAGRELFNPIAANRKDLAQKLTQAGFEGGRVSPSTLRFALIATQFTQPMNFTVDVLVQARSSVLRIQSLFDSLQGSADTEARVADEAQEFMANAVRNFDDALSDNLNMSRALAELFGVVSWANQRQLGGGEAAAVRAFVTRCDQVFAVLDRDSHSGVASNEELAELASQVGGRAPSEFGVCPEAIRSLVALRQAARLAKDFARADELRNTLLSRGVELFDMRDGVRWRA